MIKNFLFILVSSIVFMLLTYYINVISDRYYLKPKVSVNVFLFCFNEEVLLPYTINHYKKNLPNCKITIIDNMSNDSSKIIAKNHGCNIIKLFSGGQMNNKLKNYYANNIWKRVKKGWVIVADMDEWLCVSEKDLMEEEKRGTTILKVKGINMIGDSKTSDLSDINLNDILLGVDNDHESKSMCFRVPKIKEMKFNHGQHECDPIGNIFYSKRTYINKHMEYLGLNWILNKRKNRLDRRNKNHKNFSTHYLKDKDEVVKEYKLSLKKSYKNSSLILWNMYNMI